MLPATPSSLRGLQSYPLQLPTCSEEFIQRAEDGTLQQSSHLLSDPMLTAEALGEGLRKACKHGHLDNAELILDSPLAKKILPIELGFSLVALVGSITAPQKKLEVLEKLTKVPRFSEVHHPFIGQAFQAAVLGNFVGATDYFLNHHSDDLISGDITWAITTCIDNGYNRLLDKLLKSPAPAAEKEERTAKLFFYLLDIHKYEAIRQFAQNPEYQTVLQKNLGNMLAHIVHRRPVGTLTKFLSCDWTMSLSDAELTSAAVDAIDYFAKFKTLIANPRYDRIYEKGLISYQLSEEKAHALLRHMQASPFNEFCINRISGIVCVTLLGCDEFALPQQLLSKIATSDWYLGFCWAIDKGQSAHIVQLLLKQPEILSEMSKIQRENLFLRSCETSAVHSSNWAIMRTMMMNPRWLEELSQITIDRAIFLAAQLGLHEVLAVLSKRPLHFNQSEPHIIKQAFISAGSRGHLAAVKVFLEGERSEEITSKEIKHVFKAYLDDPKNQNIKEVVISLLSEPLCQKISPEDAKDIFCLLYELPDDELTHRFIASSRFNLIDEEIMEEIFAPLSELGTIQNENVAHDAIIETFNESYPEIISKKRVLEHIVQTARFLEYYRPKPPLLYNEGLSPIYVAAAGMGFATIVDIIHKRLPIRPSFPFFAALQACSNSHFSVFYRKDSSSAITVRPIPYNSSVQEKISILNIAFDQISFRPNYSDLRTWLLFASEFGNPEAMATFFKHNPRENQHSDTINQAQELAKINPNKKVLQLLTDIDYSR